MLLSLFLAATLAAPSVARHSVDLPPEVGIVQPVADIPAPGRVRPTGWLLDIMRTARDGYTARMDEVDDKFCQSWTEEMQPRGRNVHWWTKPGAWAAEGGAYWFNGLVKMAFQLDDPALKAMASNRLETVLTKTTPESWGFLWWMRRSDTNDVAALRKDSFLLVQSEKLLNAVGAWYAATGDTRAEQAIVTAFSAAPYDIYPCISGSYKAWRLTGDEKIARRLDECLATFTPGRYGKLPPQGLEETLFLKYRHEEMLHLPTRHGLGVSRGLLRTLRIYQWTGDAQFLDAVRAWYDFLNAHCRLPFGQTVMDEEWGWAGPGRGTETCTAACENNTRLELLAALGEGRWADDVEESVYNVGVACTTADFGKHVYLQQPNRIRPCDLTECSHGGDGLDPAKWTEHGLYARKHHPLCCTAGLNQIWPDFVQAMWLETQDGGVAAALFGPCTFETERVGGRFAVRETTDYPFDDTVRFSVEAAPDEQMSFRVRIPQWCQTYDVSVNGCSVDTVPINGFVQIDRVWRAGDVMVLKMNMTPRYEKLIDRNPCAKGLAAKTYGSLKVGPLLFALPLPLKDENTPLEPNAVLPEIAPHEAARAEVIRRPMPLHGVWSTASPVGLRVRSADGRTLTLVPYGTAKFRISMFPLPPVSRGCAEIN